MLKNDKMKLGKVRFERYKKFLKCFDKDAEELQKDGELLMRMLGKQVEAFNSDEVKRREAFEAEWKQINERWVKAQNEKELQTQRVTISKGCSTISKRRTNNESAIPTIKSTRRDCILS